MPPAGWPVSITPPSMTKRPASMASLASLASLVPMASMVSMVKARARSPTVAPTAASTTTSRSPRSSRWITASGAARRPAPGDSSAGGVAAGRRSACHCPSSMTASSALQRRTSTTRSRAVPPSPQAGHRHRGVESRPRTSATAGRIPSAWRAGQGRPGPRRVSAKRSRSTVRTSSVRPWLKASMAGMCARAGPDRQPRPTVGTVGAPPHALDVGSRSAHTRFDRSVRPPVRPAVRGAVRVSPHRRRHGYFPPIQLPDQPGEPHRTLGPRVAASAHRSGHPGPPSHLGRAPPGALPLH